MVFTNIYNFNSLTESNNNDWIYANPNGTTAVTGTSGKTWNWNSQTQSTSSGNTGPTGAHSGTGYIYPETSSPTSLGDIFSMEIPFDLSSTNLAIEFWYSAFTKPAQLRTSAWDGAGWVLIDSLDLNSTSPVWIQYSTDIEDYDNTDFKFRISIEVISGTTYQHDVAIDSIKIIGTDSILDNVQQILHDNNSLDKEYYRGVFKVPSDSTTEFTNIYNGLYAISGDIDWTYYYNGISLVNRIDNTTYHLKE